ncbi:hypothetical protein BT96DRAFT_947502 [Gymnopus androsaceus JB14]|uniref:Uncharacterized protein n=1 Tax=Gymnopus androsaceus JB14 TaxID=1447944 RepID=A0A6A4GSF1_9AGAR|nr:hypothetical protein BT96DRAFT_947502 [Gymnopus androsaceus JB14]
MLLSTRTLDTQPYYNTGSEYGYGNALFPAKSYPPEMWMFQIDSRGEVEESVDKLLQAVLERTGDPVDERIKFDIRDFAQTIVRGGYRSKVADEEREPLRRC